MPTSRSTRVLPGGTGMPAEVDDELADAEPEVGSIWLAATGS